MRIYTTGDNVAIPFFGQVTIEIEGADGLAATVLSGEVSTSAHYDNLALRRSDGLGSVWMQNGPVTLNPWGVGADGGLTVGVASSGYGNFDIVIGIEQTPGAQDFVPLADSGLVVSVEIEDGVEVDYELPNPAPPAMPACFWTDLVNVQQHCTPAPAPPVEVLTDVIKVFMNGEVDRDFVVNFGVSDLTVMKRAPGGGFYMHSYANNTVYELDASGAEVASWPFPAGTVMHYSNTQYRDEPDLRVALRRYDSGLQTYIHTLFSPQSGFTAFPPIPMEITLSSGGTVYKSIEYIDDTGRFYIGVRSATSAAGTSRPVQWHVERYLPDGTLDGSFTAASTPYVSSGGGLTRYYARLFAGYVFVFHTRNASAKTLVAQRFSLAGVPDPSFSPPVISNTGSGIFPPSIVDIADDWLRLGANTAINYVQHWPFAILDADFVADTYNVLDEPYDWDGSPAPNMFWPSAVRVLNEGELAFIAAAPPFEEGASAPLDRIYAPPDDMPALNGKTPAQFNFEFLWGGAWNSAGVEYATSDFILLFGSFTGYTVPGE